MNKLDSNSQRTFFGQKKTEPPADPPHQQLSPNQNKR